MHLELIRYSSLGDDSLGLLFVDGVFFCYTLEDEWRAEKIMGMTRIPAGLFRLGLRTSPKFSSKLGHDMLHVLDVPGFSCIYFHPGNTHKDTAGCVLVGDKVGSEKDGYRWVGDSRRAYLRLYEKVAPAVGAGVTLAIRDFG
jgi:hypothetical protein